MNEDCEPNDSMDGDFDSAMASAGLGTDEDYGTGASEMLGAPNEPDLPSD